MFIRTKLACSFCGKSAAEVSKLVAGPKAYICDSCVAQASRIMSQSGEGEPLTTPRAPGIWRRMSQWLLHRRESATLVSFCSTG